jgi:hypothetical protein
LADETVPDPAGLGGGGLGDAELVGDLMYGLGDGVVAFTHLDRRGLIERAAAVRWAR